MTSYGGMIGHYSERFGHAERIHSIDYTLALRAGDMHRESWDSPGIVRDRDGRAWIVDDRAPMRRGSWAAYPELHARPF
ncbi:hypothetical protein [Hyphomicrobium sp.]|uniref:hypothetical protein n=1 Tax=Hyphomicrobium sp. TaxID=82 RepID=UPI001D394FA7|nr:hypothetical protein [Hyphomicrobium sp.]MBY0559858.1 hypothetical protein [Hyphomicrobium sp.]